MQCTIHQLLLRHVPSKIEGIVSARTSWEEKKTITLPLSARRTQAGAVPRFVRARLGEAEGLLVVSQFGFLAMMGGVKPLT